MANASITIQFGIQDGVDPDTGEPIQNIQVELDDEHNTQVYGDAKSQFDFGEVAYFRTFVFPSNLAITMDNSDGTLGTNLATGNKAIENENITFSDADEASPQYPIKAGTFVAQWYGKGAPSWSIVDDKIKLNKKSLGFLRASYTTSFKRHSISVGTKDFAPYPVIIMISSVK